MAAANPCIFIAPSPSPRIGLQESCNRPAVFRFLQDFHNPTRAFPKLCDVRRVTLFDHSDGVTQSPAANELAAPDHPISRASSDGRRNTLLKFTRWSLES
jgi:hypothetical protein